MKKFTSKKIKNSTLVVMFFVLVISAVVISLVIKLCILVVESRFDFAHQFIVEVNDSNGNEKILIFNPSVHTMGILQIQHAKHVNVSQDLQIPIDAHITTTHMSASPMPLLLSTIFHCTATTCTHMNAIDALKLYIFANNIRPAAVNTENISFPVNQLVESTIVPQVTTDEKLYREALSIAVVNASGEPGLGNKLGKLLTNIGANVISITSGDIQSATTMESTSDTTSYTIDRLQQILHLTSQQVQRVGISDIVITIGKKHPDF